MCSALNPQARGAATLHQRLSQMLENAETALITDELPRPVLLYSGG
jgi:hypothetical protein